MAGRRCLVVGGGRVAARKVETLLGCRAAVTMVAPETHVALGLLARSGVIAAIDGPPLDVQIRPYQAGESAGYRLVVAATGVAEVDSAVYRDAERAGVWVNSADDPDHCSFVLPAVCRQGAVSVAVSTEGRSPALAVWVRDQLSRQLGPELGVLADLLGEARRRLLADGRSTGDVDWPALLQGPLPTLVRSGDLQGARRLLDQAVHQAVHKANGPGKEH